MPTLQPRRPNVAGGHIRRRWAGSDHCYSADNAGAAPSSPTYVPVSGLWADNKQPNHASAAQEEVVFGPGVQLQGPEESMSGMSQTSSGQVGEISELVTRMDIDSAADHEQVSAAAAEASPPRALSPGRDAYDDDAAQTDGGQPPADLYSGLFRELPEPILQAPKLPTPPPRAPKNRGAGKRSTLAATRSSLRQAARPSPIPVAERATRKLMRELEFINSQQQQAPDAAVAEYVDLYAGNLPEMAVEAIKAATRMGNKNLAKVLEAIVQEADAVEMET